MEQSFSPNPPAPGATLPADRNRWTPERQRLFLASLLATGNVTHAARAVGMSAASAHRLRRRLDGTPFDQAWGRALALYVRSLRRRPENRDSTGASLMRRWRVALIRQDAFNDPTVASMAPGRRMAPNPARKIRPETV
jgi:transposase-like protein